MFFHAPNQVKRRSLSKNTHLKGGYFYMSTGDLKERHRRSAKESLSRAYRIKALLSYKLYGHPDDRGYIRVPNPQLPGRWLYQHRLVAEEKIGRSLRTDEHVHHIDGNKANNDPKNLAVYTNGIHQLVHQGHLQGKFALEILAPCRCGCGILVPDLDKNGRPRLGFVHGHRRKK